MAQKKQLHQKSYSNGMNTSGNAQLNRGLKQRHITLMSLGSAIGVGLFLGSASAIKLAGPSILLAYIAAGVAMFFIMRALGEMAIQNPVAGSFSRYAQDHIGPMTGFITGWNYWFVWVVTCMGEITAIGVYMKFWFPDTPAWIWALAGLVVMSAVNFIHVKAYGEFEFWFALIKIVTIILMIVLGLLIIIFGIGNGGAATGIHNLWDHGGFFAHGFKGFLFSFQIVMFAYLGIEMIGLTAGEVENPEKTLSKAIDNVFWRILIFYVGTLFVVMSIYPWNEIGTSNSPFVLTFEKLGIRGAAGIINFVVLTAALSSCNTGIFSTGRMLFNLAEQGQAPKMFGKLTKSGIPVYALIASGLALLVGVILNMTVPEEAFTWITSIATVGAIWTWAIILLSQIGFRRKMSSKQVANLSYKTPLYPIGSVLTLAFLAMVIVLIAWSPDTRIAIYVGIVWYALLILFYLLGSIFKTVEK